MSAAGRFDMFCYHLLSMMSVNESYSVMFVRCSEKPSVGLVLILSLGLPVEVAVDTRMLSNFSMRFDLPCCGSCF